MNRLKSIDSLRGVAALAVVLFHSTGSHYNYTFFEFVTFQTLTSPYELANLLVSFGDQGVPLFFVISGFCIHMRWAKAKVLGLEPDIHFGRFWKRRIRRLYPPYLVALAIFTAGLYLVGRWHLTAFSVYDTVMHLLLIHNLDRQTLFSLNGVFWTLALEEQLYLLYFILLPLRRRLGWGKALAICFAARLVWYVGGMAVARLTGINVVIEQATLSNWAVWALGAMAVEGAVGLIELPAWCKRARVAIASLLVTATVAYLSRFAGKSGLTPKLLMLLLTPMWGVSFFFVVNTFVAREKAWAHKLSIRAFAAIGLFSYSLYLMHELALQYGWPIAERFFKAPESLRSTIFVVVLAPLSVVISWVFFQFFEKPFMSAPQTMTTTGSRVALTDTVS